MKKGASHIMEVGSRYYRITDDLAKRMKIKSFLLFTETIALSLFYLFAMEKFRAIPFSGAEKSVIIEGLGYTMLFLFLMICAFLVTSFLLIPHEVHLQMVELDEYEKAELLKSKSSRLKYY